jgi:oligopeptidase B
MVLVNQYMGLTRRADASGQERNTVYFMQMDTKTLLPERIEGVYEDLEFNDSGTCVYYTILDDCERAHKMNRHVIGQPVDQDETIYHERDEMFFLNIKTTCDGAYVVLKSTAQITSETHVIATGGMDCVPSLLFARQENINYTVEHYDGWWYVLTNEDGKNNWIFRVPVSSVPKPESAEALLALRETVIDHRDFVLVEGLF